MDRNASRAFAQRLRNLAACLTPIDAPAVVHKHLCIDGGKTNFSLVDDAFTEFLGLVHDIQRHGDFSIRFSESHIASLLASILQSYADDHDDSIFESRFEGLVVELENYDLTNSVYLPIDGVVLQVASFEVGNVTFHRLDSTFRDQFRQRLRTILRKVPRESVEEKGILDESIERIARAGPGSTCAEVKARAEPGRAEQLALIEIDEALDVLRLAVPVLYPGQRDLRFGVFGIELLSDVSTVIIPEDEHTAILSSFLPRSIGPFVISPESIEVLRALHIPEFSSILAKSRVKRTDFEATLLRGSHWFAGAQKQLEPENRLLSLVVCLETLLNPVDRAPVGSSIAEGVALLIGKNLGERKRIRKRILDFYSMRSGISHGGKKSISDNDVTELTEVTLSMLMLLIDLTAKLRTRRDLLDWLEERRLGG